MSFWKAFSSRLRRRIIESSYLVFQSPKGAYVELEQSESMAGFNNKDVKIGDVSPVSVETVDEATEEEHRRIRLKVDLRLVVLVGFMYCVSLMDRSNLANANTAGMGCAFIPAGTKVAPPLQYCVGSQGLDLRGFRYVSGLQISMHN
jgi:hypothetical protein